jgi:hypothetical protein
MVTCNSLMSSRPSRAPFGDVIAGSSGVRPLSRRARIGTSRSGIGTLRRPARLLGGPSSSRPDSCDRSAHADTPCWQVDVADHLHHHRPGDRGHGRMAIAPTGFGVPGDLHRRREREDPRRERREPPGLHRAGGDGGVHPRHPRVVGRRARRRGRGEVFGPGALRKKGLPAAIDTVWPQAIPQTCIVHLLRNSFRPPRVEEHWAALAKDLKPIYTAPSESAALDAFVALTEAWGHRYPAIIKLWESAWPELVPFLQFDTHIRTVICTTNATIESIMGGSAGRSTPAGISYRDGRTEMRVPRYHEPRSDRPRTPAMVQPAEGGTQRLRDHLRRTPIHSPKVEPTQSVTPNC